MPDPIRLSEKLAKVTETWFPHAVTTFNGHDVMVVKVEGEFVWHSYPETDDFFLVQTGALDVELPDGVIRFGPGDLHMSCRKGSSTAL
jgi:mannose-6-phosphate isomerase-like protein (cupin superfamily)